MARTDTLEHFLGDVADSIRSQTGGQETIQASDFDTAIEGIINNEDKTITEDGEYTASSGYTGIGTATVSTGAATYKGSAVSWGNAIDKMSYYLAGNWGEPTPHTYTYEELVQYAPVASQTVTEGITNVQQSKGTLAQTIANIYQGKGVVPSVNPNLNGDKIGVFVTALLSQIAQMESKNTTITSNGTTTISTTSGKYGMNSVSVTTNVQPDLETKSVSITTNGTTTVTPSQDKDGISSIEITTNVSGGADLNDYFLNSSTSQGAAGFIKKMPAITITNTYNINNCFSGFYALEEIEGITITSTNISAANMFASCSKLKSIPLFDTSGIYTFTRAFANCSSIETIPSLNTGKITSFDQLFYGCTNLKNVPVLDTSKVTGTYSFRYTFKDCPALTDVSLDNILQMCINATTYAETKTLTTLGITDTTVYPTSRIEALPHYQDFIDAGWTIGY